MLKIGDFSKFSRVSIKTLRFYDEIGLLKPVSVDQFSGYRYYSAEQLPRLNRIIGFKNLGLSLDEISLLMTDNLPVDKVIEVLKAKQKESMNRLRQEEARLKKVEEWLKKVEKEGFMPEYDVNLKKIEEMQIASVRGTIPTYGDISRLYKELFSYLGRKRVQYAGPPMAVYHDCEYKEKDADVEAAIPVTGNIQGSDKVKIQLLPGVEQAAFVLHKGPYENFSRAYSALMTWVEANGYQICGPNREVYLKGPGQILKGNPQEYITEIQLPVKKE
jgi:effector-binding domain-containing protein